MRLTAYGYRQQLAMWGSGRVSNRRVAWRNDAGEIGWQSQSWQSKFKASSLAPNPTI